MKRSFNVTVNGQEFSVEVEELSSSSNASVVKPSAAPTIQNLASVPSPAPIQPVSPSSSNSNDITSPMAGVVVKVEVTNGEAVNKGQTLLILEAMKMETPIVAIKNGTVSAVHVKTDDKVENGQQLITFA